MSFLDDSDFTMPLGHHSKYEWSKDTSMDVEEKQCSCQKLEVRQIGWNGMDKE